MTSVTVCIPWVRTECPWRIRARDWVLAHWAGLGVPVVVGEGDNRSRARNEAVSRADGEVLFFADADTVVMAREFRSAVNLAASTGRMVVAFSRHLKFTKDMTSRILDSPGMDLHAVPQQFSRVVKKCSSGCNAVPRGSFDAIGGYDERFHGWGGEDRSFKFAMDTLVGPTEEVAGYSFHLWHPLGRDAIPGGPAKETIELALRYKMAAGVEPAAGFLARSRGARLDREAMWRILGEPGGPLDPTRRDTIQNK